MKLKEVIETVKTLTKDIPCDCVVIYGSVAAKFRGLDVKPRDVDVRVVFSKPPSVQTIREIAKISASTPLFNISPFSLKPPHCTTVTPVFLHMDLYNYGIITRGVLPPPPKPTLKDIHREAGYLVGQARMALKVYHAGSAPDYIYLKLPKLALNLLRLVYFRKTGGWVWYDGILETAKRLGMKYIYDAYARGKKVDLDKLYRDIIRIQNLLLYQIEPSACVHPM